MTRTQGAFISVGRALSYVAIVGAAVAAVTVLLSAGWRTIVASSNLAMGLSESKATVYELIRVVDLFLIATVFYIVSVGLYQLFVDQTMSLPQWMQIAKVDDLKNKMLRLAVVVLAVHFLGEVLRWTGDPSILPFGAAIALVIAAVSFFLKVSASSSH